MKKLAVFVEGQTEQLFVQKLLYELASEKKVQISIAVLSGPIGQRRIKYLPSATVPPTSPTLYVQIVTSCNDEQVKSDILDRYNTLKSSGFDAIIGIRDVYDEFSHTEIPKLRIGLSKGTPHGPPSIDFILAVMEIEAWFLAEYTHYSKISKRISLENIRENLNFDPENDNLELLVHPSADLNRVYNIGGKSYSKQLHTVQKVLSVLDFELIYADLPGRFPDFARLISIIESML